MIACPICSDDFLPLGPAVSEAEVWHSLAEHLFQSHSMFTKQRFISSQATFVGTVAPGRAVAHGHGNVYASTSGVRSIWKMPQCCCGDTFSNLSAFADHLSEIGFHRLKDHITLAALAGRFG